MTPNQSNGIEERERDTHTHNGSTSIDLFKVDSLTDSGVRLEKDINIEMTQRKEIWAGCGPVRSRPILFLGRWIEL